MSDQEFFYLLMGIFLLSLVVITIFAFAMDSKINKRIRMAEKKLFESLFEEKR